MTIAVSGSSFERVAACPASACLPQVRTTSEAAEKGTAVHAFLAEVGRLGYAEALARVPDEWREACQAIDLAELPPLEQLAAEVAFAYDYDKGTARELGRDLGRAYPELGPTEIPLTLDAVGLTPDAGVLVLDWKTGRSRQTRARKHWQLILGALAATRAYGRAHATVALVRVFEGEAFFDAAQLDELDLDAAELEVREVMRRVAHARDLLAKGLQPPLVQGDHCRYCPAFAACPAQTALIRQATSTPEIVEDVRQLLSPANVAEAYRRVKAFKVVLDRVTSALYAYAQTEGPIDLGDGLVFGPRKVEREKVDGRVARDVLLRLHGPEIADQACDWDASKKSIEDALRAVAQKSGAKITHLKNETLEAIREAGGISTSVSVTCTEHRPPKKAA